MDDRQNLSDMHNYWADVSGFDVIDAIIILRKAFKSYKIEEIIYSEGNEIPENIIFLYMYYLRYLSAKKFRLIIDDYKALYIDNEAVVEPNVTPEEKEGLGIIYDYIGDYDFENKQPNIFLDGMKMHMLLYSKCPFPEYGGKLRQEPVKLKDVNYDVPDAVDARSFFQGFITSTPKFDSSDIFGYLNACVIASTKLIAVQPFTDGNKRTFRGVLNLMFAQAGIPPVYIKQSERALYKELLLKAIENEDYSGITRFYYFKICDAIVDLNMDHFMREYKSPESNETISKKFVILKKPGDSFL